MALARQPCARESSMLEGGAGVKLQRAISARHRQEA
jgi:hypothetical protein